jgi:hypothetical protein
MPCDKDIYHGLVNQARSAGWIVQQRKLSPSDYGSMFVDSKRIYIEKHTTWRIKMHSLAHELGHVQQVGLPEWRRFFATAKFPDTKRNRTYVIDAELDASRRAKTILEQMGAVVIDFPELDPVRFELHMKGAWLDEYIER